MERKLRYVERVVALYRPALSGAEIVQKNPRLLSKNFDRLALTLRAVQQVLPDEAASLTSVLKLFSVSPEDLVLAVEEHHPRTVAELRDSVKELRAAENSRAEKRDRITRLPESKIVYRYKRSFFP
jgi:hypothetical protein